MMQRLALLCCLLALCEGATAQGGLGMNGGIQPGANPPAVVGMPTIPSNAYRYSDIEREPTSCPSYTNSAATTQSNPAPNACFQVDTIDATGAAGAGIQTLSSILFGVAGPAPLGGAAMSFDVANMPPVVTTATGSSGSNTITVASVTNLNNKQGEVVTGTGIGSGAQICYAVTGACSAAWNGTSTTIPLTVVNSGAVSGNVTFTTSFVSNGLAFNHLITGSNTGISNMLIDLYYSVSATIPNTATAIEFDPDIFTGNYQVMASFQCDIYSGSAAPGQWRFWDSASQSWTLLTGYTYSCANASTPGVHHLVAYSTYNTTVTPPTYAYQALTVDGVSVFTNLNYQHSGSVTGYNLTSNQLNVQAQIDGLSNTPRSLPANLMMYGNWNVFVW